ncbi:hypothetical protein [Thalassoroseus pseudoceratinae]|uniref:hypothetical protein n=1 Tax=Thalassoroseus pseudoceratinae TaxID=2713176 RepID=UPI00141E49CD|nr:hypothetical protein [Thalassoroseus pseudoceratinae]
MSRFLRSLMLASAILLSTVGSASACPMCKEANKKDSKLPQAYMYSILFMMSMPVLVFTGFGVTLYRLHRNAQADQQAEAEFNDWQEPWTPDE